VIGNYLLLFVDAETKVEVLENLGPEVLHDGRKFNLKSKQYYKG
jgi:hypothetical protein